MCLSATTVCVQERLCDFYLHVMSDKEEATFRLREAVRYYSDWGASAKVTQLEEMYPDLLPTPSEIIVSFS